jgi:hypothetical protein
VERDEYWALAAIILWIAAIIMILLGIWMPSWQWTATGVLIAFVGWLSMVIGDEL